MKPRNSTLATGTSLHLFRGVYLGVLLAISLFGQAAAQMNVTINYSAPNCPGDNSGLATAHVTGGQAPYNYYWSNGQTGQTISNPAAGSLSITVTDAAYHSANASTTVTIPATFVVAVNAAPDPCAPGSNYLVATATGATPPYNYAWSNGGSGTTINNLTQAGYYFVTVTDSKGCIKVGGKAYSPPVSVNIVTVPSKCPGTCDGSIEAKVSGGVAPYSFAWSSGMFPNSQQQAPANEGLYTVTVTDGSGCTDVETAFLDDPDPIQIGLAYSNPCGSPTNLTASVTGGSPPYSYDWNFGQNGQTAYGVQAGTWMLRVFDSHGCAKEQSVSIANSDMQLSLQTTPADCRGLAGGSATVQPSGGSGAYTYLWSNGQTTPSATNLPAGDHSVTVFDGTGCLKTATVSVQTATAFQLATQTTPYFCDQNGGTASISISGGTTAGYTFHWNDPQQQSSQTATGLTPGDYKVTVTNAEGCSSVSNIAIPDASMAVAMTFQDATCDNNGSAAISVSNNTGQVNYLWSNGLTGASVANLTPGSYTVTATDANGCTETMLVDVQDKSFDIHIAVMQQGCAGEATGMLQATVTGGNGGNYTYQWNNWGQSNTIATLMPGAYEVTVTDNTGCQRTAEINLTSSPEIVFTSNIVNAPCENLANGNLAVNVNAGAAPFTYQWSNGSVAAQASGLAAGAYTLTITDANGCTQTVDLQLENEHMELEVDLLRPTCDNIANGSAIVNVSGGGSAPFSYSWSNGSSAPNLNDLATGSYTVTVTDGFGCSAVQAFVVEPEHEVDAAFAWASLGCDDTGVNVQFTGNSTNGATWQWVLGNGQISNEQNPQILVNQSPMTVQLIVTSPEGCQATAEQTIEAAPISLALQNVSPACENALVQINLSVTNPGGGALTYDWSPDNLIVSGEGTPNPVFAANAAGQYNLSVSVSNGTCTVGEDALMEVLETVTADPAAISSQQCQDMVVNFNNNSAMSGTWYFDYPNQAITSNEQNPSYTYTNTGSYQVAFVPEGQCAEPLLIPLAVSLPPVVSFEVSAADCNEPITVTFTNTSDVPGGVTSFFWDFGAFGTSTEPNPQLTISGSQVVNAQLVAGYGNGCQQTVVDEISVNSFTPPVLVGQLHACESGNVVELNPNGDPGFTYVWSGGNLSDPTAVNPTATVSQTTTYNVVITAPNGCSTTQAVTVEVPSTPFALLPMDNIIACDYEPLNLLAQTNAPATSFLWSTDSDFDTNVGTDQSLTVQTSVQPITYWVQATDPHGCVAVASLAVQNAAIDLDFDNAFQTCNGYPAIIKVDAIDVSTFTNWQPFNPMETPLFEDGIFTFSVSNDLGCTGDGEVVVKVAEFTGTISADAEPEEIWAGQTTVLSVTTKPTYSYVWSPVLGLSDPFSANPVATPETSMTYTVEVTDEETGCRSNDEIEVKVKDIICDEPYIYLPNAFTPNGDGTNDILKVEGINVEEVYLTIYDRWGEKVFETASLDQGWDGSFRGQVVSGDVYGYYLTVRCPGGLEFFKKGNITVLR